MSHRTQTSQWPPSAVVSRTLWSVFTVVLMCLPGVVSAKVTTSFNPAHPPAVQFTVLPDGSIRGPQTLNFTVRHTDKPASVLVGCDKIGTITVYANNGRATRIAGWLDFSRHTLCNFTKHVKSAPFSGDNIRAACIGNPSHTIQQHLRIDFGDAHNKQLMMNDYATITAHVSCPSGQAPVRASGNAHPVNACDLSGDWSVWQTSPGRFVPVPFALLTNQGRTDVYQVSVPNKAGVTGSAVVNGYKVTISLQASGPGASSQTVSGTMDRGCATLSGSVVRSDPPIGLRATRRGGSGSNGTRHNTTRSVRSGGRSSNTAHHRSRPPHVNTRVTPKWNTQLR